MSAQLAAQQEFRLHVFQDKLDSIDFQKIAKPRAAYSDTTRLRMGLQELIRNLQNQAWLEASIDSISWQGKSAFAYLHLGEKYEWASLRNGNIPENFLNQSGFRQGLYTGRVFSYAELIKVQERLLKLVENNGYPFASVYLDSIQIESGKVEAQLFVETSRMVFFDSLVVNGDAGISHSYLRSYLGIKKGEPFSRKKVMKITDRLREISFLKEKNNAQVTFWEDQASVTLFLEKRKASRFDFLLGFLPDNRRESNRLILTGTFNAGLQNQLGMGEQFAISFERLRPQTQKLELSASIPYILDLPFGIDASFYQYKRDSTYTDIKGNFGLQYLLEGGTYVRAFSRTDASNLITVDTASIRKGKLPAQLDVKTTAYGLEGNLQRLDYRFNPRSGWNINLTASAGFRKIRKNQAILQVAPLFYDTLPKRNTHFSINTSVVRYFPIFERSTIKAALQSGLLLSKSPVYQNEQYRLGGSKLLRGFDEESVFASSFAVFTLEYRLLVGQNSYFNLFSDYSFLQDRKIDAPVRNEKLLGIGAGLTFETTAGIFAVSVAIGKPEGIGIDLRNPKVHFGYVTYF